LLDPVSVRIDKGAGKAKELTMTLPKIILVPTDFGEPSEAALDYAMALAKPFGAEIVLLHSFEVPIVGFPDGAMMATAELTNRILEGAQAGLDRQVERCSGKGVTVRGVVKQGDAWRTVVATSEELGAGLIVMGTHGRKGLPRALIGSVAEKVVRTSPVPVLTVHAGEGQTTLLDASAGERTVRSTAKANDVGAPSSR
jgi:nucleotide-binding universal stress UspA family protein